MHPILFKIGGASISSWGAMMVLGAIAGFISALFLSKKEKIAVEDVLAIFGCAIFSALIGGRLFYAVIFWKEFSADPLSIFAISRGGFIMYGAALFCFLAVFSYARYFKLNLSKLLDVGIVVIMIWVSMARIGCFLNGCCYGIVTKLPIGVQFPGVSGIRHPTQLYSSAAAFIIFLILLYIGRKKRYDGEVFLAGAVLYAIDRFAVEFLRSGPKVFLGLTLIQIIIILFFAILISLLALKRKSLKT